MSCVFCCKFESVRKWFKSLDDSAPSRGKAGLTKQAKRVRLSRFWEYTKGGKINPDKLLEEAQQDIDKAGQRLNEYFRKRIKSGVSWNTVCTEVSFIRGFYSHNNLRFPKKYPIPKNIANSAYLSNVESYNAPNLVPIPLPCATRPSIMSHVPAIRIKVPPTINFPVAKK